jgi:uncharacterized membrane protein YbhN (UPF0104 family)
VDGRQWLRAAASATLSGGLCFLLLRQVDLAALPRLLASADPSYLTIFGALSFAGLFTRAARYKFLLGPAIGFGPVLLVTAARNFLVDLLPARVGALSYVYLLTRRLGVPLEPVLASFVLPFVYDLLAMATLVGLALAFELGRLEGRAVLLSLVLVLAAGSVVAFILLAPSIRFTARMLGQTARLAPLARRLTATAEQIERDASPRRTTALVVFSLVIRGIKFAAYWSLLLAVLHERGFGPRELPFWRVFLGVTGAELSATLPIHGIAGFGTYETAWTLGFTHLGLDRETAILSGFATHLLSQLLEYAIGAAALAIVLARSRRDG